MSNHDMPRRGQGKASFSRLTKDTVAARPEALRATGVRTLHTLDGIEDLCEKHKLHLEQVEKNEKNTIDDTTEVSAFKAPSLALLGSSKAVKKSQTQSKLPQPRKSPPAARSQASTPRGDRKPTRVAESPSISLEVPSADSVSWKKVDVMDVLTGVSKLDRQLNGVSANT